MHLAGPMWDSFRVPIITSHRSPHSQETMTDPTTSPLRFLLAFPLALAACSGSTVSLPAASDDAGGHLHSSGSVAASSGASGIGIRSHSGSSQHPTADAAPGSDAGGAVVYVRVESVQTPVGSGSSQETPTDQRVGILGLTLLRSASDPSPLVVFKEAQPIDTPYNAGSSTLIGTARASSLVGGTYLLARVPVAYVKFTVAGTYHFGVTPVLGDFTDLIALTSGSTLDGATRDRGWWSSSFAVGGRTEGQVGGENAEIAQPGSGSRLGLDLSGPVAAYVFPVSLVIPEAIASDLEIVFTVNTYQDFHWQDQTEAGYEPGVFDVSQGGFEPVTQLGANSFTVTVGPASAH
jgi:hypothetical protein